MIVYRSGMDTLWLKIQANEQLGLLDSSYLQDYFGNTGQLTLHHVSTGTDYPVVMVELPAETPEIPHDVFSGPVALDALPNGQYQLRGRVKDIVDNYTILSVVQTPIGGENTVTLSFEIRAGSSKVYRFSAGPLALVLGWETGIAIQPRNLSAVLTTGVELPK